jgi:hypothetical protein
MRFETIIPISICKTKRTTIEETWGKLRRFKARRHILEKA